MQKLSKRQKNNLIIGGLCCILLLMGIGYAAFSTQLKINGTSSISSEWKVLITDITSGSIVGGASNASEPTHTDTTATFNTNLVSPGDSITYTIKVENRGSIDATLSSIDVNTGNNDAIEFETSGIEEGDSLLQGASDELYVKVTYSNSVTSQPENTTSTITVTLNYEQKGSSVTPPPSGPTIGGQDVELVSTGDGLYEDEYESGRYVYKGANPNNYIQFDNGEMWRIIAKEADGTYKIVKNDVLPNQVWDSTNSNDWTRPADLNTYLNGEYYESLDSSIKQYIVSHTWGIGAVTRGNNDLAGQIASENGTTWNDNIGLISVSDYLRANTNIEQCGTLSLNNDNSSTCRTTNWLFANDDYWTISPRASTSYSVFSVSLHGSVNFFSAASSDYAPRPAAYLSSDITLSGTGIFGDPYVIS